MIWAKKRFMVLERDKFRCQYCWKNGKDVSLEVDHIIPKSKWGTDELDNLITCCRECNIWKWNDIVGDIKWIIKMKIRDKETEIIKDFFYLWNEYWLWTIDNKNLAYVSWFIKSYFNWDTVVGYVKQCLAGKIWKLCWEWKLEMKDFYEWGDNCDLAINEWKTFVWENDVGNIIDRVKNDENYDEGERFTDDYNERLNWLISIWIAYNREPMSLLYKYSLFPNMVETWQRERENL